ncbi:hypothetical protein [Streptomyces endophyticus]|uniref:Uncharacterized protein n=1 Tax=Streptomyces endophyticus TaxID=714166 RepID=A0ABU6FII1_9ACTN|nr:hypothetical protein [Streptomyces endophyticus]MEB8342661.1 hypothetical protein [Streptomyces endophyticus]
MIAAFVVLAAWFSFQAVYSGGNIGTRGTFTASSCEKTVGRTPGGGSRGNGSSHELEVTCDGAFRPDGGAAGATSVRMTLQPGDAPVTDGDAYLRKLMNTGGKGTELHAAHLNPDTVPGNFLGEFNTSNPEKTEQSALIALGSLFFLAAGIFSLRADWPRGGGGSLPLKVAWRESVGPGTRGTVITVASAAVIGIILAKILI